MRRATSLALLATTAHIGGGHDAAAQQPALPQWTGFYIGGNVGYSWGALDSNLGLPGFTTPDGSGLPVFIRGFSLPVSLQADGVIGGGQFGWNTQFGNWVFGFEFDLQASEQRDSHRTQFNFTQVIGTVTGTHIVTLDSKLDWFSTLRSRFGFAWDGLLFYGTGGVALAEFTLSGTRRSVGTVADGEGIATFNNPTTFTTSKTRAGWTIGGGIEGVLAAPNWTWRVEVLYLDFGTFGHSFNAANGGVITSTTQLTDVIARFGLNFRFP